MPAAEMPGGLKNPMSAMSMSQSQLVLLPDEVIQSILEYATPQTAISLGQVSKRFREITDEPLIWRKYCLSTYKYWSKSHELERRMRSKEPVDWKPLFIQRRTTDRRVQRALDELIASQADRGGKLERIARASYDAKEVLFENLSSARDHEDVLARRYWAHAALSSVHRDAALSFWSEYYARQTQQTPRDLELLLGAFTLFVRVDEGFGLSDVSSGLDNIAAQIRQEHPYIMDLSDRQRALTIAIFLLQNRLVGINSDREYHSLSHNFISLALTSEDHSSLPLISVAIFCCVCVRFQLRATPCSFPYHVHAMVYPEPGMDLDGLENASTGDPMYLDPWRSPLEVSIQSMREQLSMLPGIGHSGPPADHFLAPAFGHNIALRCARNISTSIRQFNIRPNSHEAPEHRIHPQSARYAASWAMVLLGAPPPHLDLQNADPRMLSSLQEDVSNLSHIFTSDFPLDAPLMQRYLLPTMQQAGFGLDQIAKYTRGLSQMREEDAKPRPQKLRSKFEAGHVKYRVGQVFRHHRYNYRAVIIGWDAKCEARHDWIETMGVDRLGGGREQPFYHSLVLEDRSTRYVASENITLLTPPETDNFFPEDMAFPDHFLQPEEFALEVGRYFARWDQERGMFVNGMRDEYPED